MIEIVEIVKKYKALKREIKIYNIKSRIKIKMVLKKTIIMTWPK